ncbi:hypothetical protein PDPUS_2_00069 [Photobacterium damselae subsp. piscicida]|uniref:IS1 family transposase n=1 Tax=Photobacterium damsela subsp. piscicida TaxID=38294 RepID=A0AAD1CHZ9_PHODP|nr:IS1 family transposase [Photobacterium damselae]BAX54655.1 hypothetical protein PDPUS_2_00069 [Photobacterium damselae subsp. piscicida]
MATIDVKCRFCNQAEQVRKYGTNPRGAQRYRCFDCNRTFLLDYAYEACKPGVKEKIVDMAMNSSGVRKTIGFSKSEEMHDKVIGTFIEREFYH